MLVAEHLTLKYGGDFSKIPSESPDGIAVNFCTQYYYIRANYPSEVHKFYKSDSSIDMHQQPNLLGRDTIRVALQEAWVSGAKNFIASLNCFTISPELMCIMSSGTCVKASECRSYSETFILQKSSDNVYYIKNQILHFLNEETESKQSGTMNNHIVVQSKELADVTVVATQNLNNGIDLNEIENDSNSIVEQKEDFDVVPEISKDPECNNNYTIAAPVTATKTWAQRANNSLGSNDEDNFHKNGSTASMSNGKQSTNKKPDVSIETSETSSSMSPPGLSNAALKSVRGKSDSVVKNVNVGIGTRTNKLDDYPNKQQLFIGNLPFDLDNDTLIEFFSRFGNVVDLQIIPTQNKKNVPNFGFIVFDSEHAVKEILQSRPHYINGTQRINVEAKKYTGSMSSMNTGGGGGGNGAGYNSYNRFSRGGANHTTATATGGGGGSFSRNYGH